MESTPALGATECPRSIACDELDPSRQESGVLRNLPSARKAAAVNHLDHCVDNQREPDQATHDQIWAEPTGPEPVGG